MTVGLSDPSTPVVILVMLTAAAGGSIGAAAATASRSDHQTRVAAVLSGLLGGLATVALVSLPGERVLGWVLLGAAAVAFAPAVFVGTLAIRVILSPAGKVAETLAHPAHEKDGRIERAGVRLGIPVLLVCAAVSAVLVSLHASKSEVPDFAFGSHVVLAVQLALLFSYGALLLLVPLVRALAGGELPIELSMRGARFAEKLGESNKTTVDRLVKFEKDTAAQIEGAKEYFDAKGQALQGRAEGVDRVLGNQEKINAILFAAINRVEDELRRAPEEPGSADPG